MIFKNKLQANKLTKCTIQFPLLFSSEVFQSFQNPRVVASPVIEAIDQKTLQYKVITCAIETMQYTSKLPYKTVCPLIAHSARGVTIKNRYKSQEGNCAKKI